MSSYFNPLLSRLDLRAGVEQPFDCLADPYTGFKVCGTKQVFREEIFWVSLYVNHQLSGRTKVFGGTASECLPWLRACCFVIQNLRWSLLRWGADERVSGSASKFNDGGPPPAAGMRNVDGIGSFFPLLLPLLVERWK